MDLDRFLSLPLLLLLLLLLLCATVAWPEQSTPGDLFPCPDPRPWLVGLDGLGIGDVRLAFCENLGVFGVQLLLRLRGAGRVREDTNADGVHDSSC